MLAELAVNEERQASIHARIEIAVRVVAGKQIDRAASLAFGQRQVGHADVEPVVLLELEVAQV